LQHVGKFSPGGAVADFLSLATAIIAGLPRRKGDGTLATFCGEVNQRKASLVRILSRVDFFAY
jgi:hypothetical protein